MKGSDQSWVTTASDDFEALQAWVLAVSLKRTFTTRKLTIILSEKVSSSLAFVLGKEFDLVLKDPTIQPEEQINGHGRSQLKFCIWNLKLWKKCVYIAANSMVLQNCDQLFDLDEFSSIIMSKDESISRSPIFICQPNPITFEKILLIQEKIRKEKQDSSVISAVFKGWDKNPNHVLDNSYSVSAEEELSHEFPKIIVFNEVPWKTSNSQRTYQELQEKWFKFYMEDILPQIMAVEINHIRTFVDSLVKSIGLPLKKNPANGFPKHQDDEQLANSIAIIGMSCRFPEANNAEEFWNLLAEGLNGVKRKPEGRLSVNYLKDDTIEGGFLKCSIDEFDATFFGISPREASYVDPQQRLLLEVTWEGLENAGINPHSLRETDTGVFVGIWQQDYEKLIPPNDLSAQEFHHRYLGNALSATASRISYFLGLNGPNIAVESGCSSSLGALHLACESLRRGEIALGISSGVNLTLVATKPLVEGDNTVVLSPDYRCKTFDEKANGFVRAEGCGTLVLKRFGDAFRDGDNILAIVRGSAMNNDGAGTSFGTPNALSQEKVYREALKNSNVLPCEVSYVEAHGTGTAVGDPIEMHALSQVYSEERKEPLYVASVKTNIGHTESAAGIAGMIKTILSLQHKAIPPHLNLETLNPYIDLTKIPAIIPQKLTNWNSNKRIAGVSSFSMSGTNVHVLVQEAPLKTTFSTQHNRSENSKEYICISAKSEEALKALATNYTNYLQNNPNIRLDDFAFTTNACRAHFSHRIGIIAANISQLTTCLQKHSYTSCKIPTVRSKIGFLFTGQGSQYIGMGKQLCEISVAFKDAFNCCAKLFKFHLGTSLENIMWNDEKLLQKTIYCQPAIFCLQYCLIQHWKALGVQPDFVLGHSVGEFAAAVCAGVLSLEDAMKLVVERSRLVNELEEGRMLVIKEPIEKINLMIENVKKIHKNCWIDIAAINSNDEVVVSCTVDSIEKLVDYCLNNNIKAQKLSSSHAFHSRAMNDIMKEFGSVTETVIHKNPNCSYISGTKAEVMDYKDFTSTYWKDHLRKTVRFSDAVKLLWSFGCTTLLEIGAQPILLGLTMANINDSHIGIFCPSLRRSDKDWNVALDTINKLYSAGYDLNWKEWYAKRCQKLADLPTYAFQRQRYWYEKDDDDFTYESGICKGTKTLHPLLGHLIPSALPDQVYSQIISKKVLPYLEDHKVGQMLILPGAAFLECALAIGKELVGGNASVPITIEDLNIEAALNIDKGVHMQSIVKCKKDEENGVQYNISFHRPAVAGQYDNWRRHAQVTFIPGVQLPGLNSLNIEDVKARLKYRDSLENTYECLATKGIEFGPKFRSIKSAWTSSTEILTLVETPADYNEYVCHPIILDAIFQTSGFGYIINQSVSEEDNQIRLPFIIRKFIWMNKEITKSVYIHSRDLNEEKAEVSLYNENGEKLALLEGLELIKVTVDSFIRSLRADSIPVPGFYNERWVQSLGVTSSRIDIGNLINVKKNSSDAGIALENFNEAIRNDKRKIYFTNSMCFHQIIKSVQECGWKLPNVGEKFTPESWKSELPEQLKDTKIYLTFAEAFAQENFVDEKIHVVLQPFPSVQQCNEIIQELKNKIVSILGEDVDICFEFAKRCCEHLTDVLQGKMSALQLLFPSDPNTIGASKFYHECLWYTMSNDTIIASLSDMCLKLTEKGSGILRILEVGAGTGATSKKILSKLNDMGVNYHYTFTDISHQFLSDARDQFGDTNMSYDILNLEQDPLSQGFSPGTYDIIIGIQVIHATASIKNSLLNMHTLLKNNGILMLSEIYKTSHNTRVSFALLPGWWRFTDNRTSSPICDGRTWRNLLQDNGYIDVEELDTIDNEMPVQIYCRASKHLIPSMIPYSDKIWILFGENSALMASVARKLSETRRIVYLAISDMNSQELRKIDDSTFLLNYSEPSQFMQLFRSINQSEPELELEGTVYFSSTLDDGDVSLLGLAQKCKCGGLLHWFQGLVEITQSTKIKPKVLVVTRGVHYLGDQDHGNPNNATVWGAFRTFMNEYPDFQANIVDLDQNMCVEAENEVNVEELSSLLWSRSTDKYVLIRDGKKYAQRLSAMEKPSNSVSLPNTDRFTFVFPDSGAFSDIQVGPSTKQGLEDDEVEVAVQAVALNFKDLLVVLKPEGFEEELSSQMIGLDVSGIITNIGPNVSSFKAGDEVFGFSTFGLQSHAIVRERMLMRKPKSITFVGAATIPCVFLTSYYSLVHVAQISNKDRILIHVAAGGVGLSAIQVAKYYGAEIYATAGSKRKRAYLRSLGIRYVYHSRNTSYEQQIMQDSKGEGVTIVLNSLTSPNFKEATLNCCAQGASFLEIGKLNIWTEEEVYALRPDNKYTIIDLSALVGKRDLSLNPGIENSLTELTTMFEKQIFKSLPHTTFSLERIRDAFYYFQEAKHIGKIVIKMPEAEFSSDGRFLLKHSFFDSESTYLITGGLGGLGIETAKWMVTTGAKIIVLVSRNKPTLLAKEVIDKLNSKDNVNITTMNFDVGDYHQCKLMLQEIKKMGLPPLRGIFLASGVLSDSLTQNQNWEKFNDVFYPKVYSAMYLHNLTLDYDLEFFTMFSSFTAVMGTPGQCNHASASRFLDSLAHYRISFGLPGASINWGAWSDVGAAAHLKIGQEGLIGIKSFTPKQGVRAIEKFMAQNYTQACVLEASEWSTLNGILNLGNFLNELKSDVKVNTSEEQLKLLEEIKNALPEERQAKIQQYLEDILKHTLRLAPTDAIDPDQNFTDLGVDSLMAMEMRNRLQGMLGGKTLTISSLQENRTIRSLSTHLANLLNSDELESRPIMELVKADSILPADIVVQNEDMNQICASQIKAILLTGATGYLGANLLFELSKTNLIIYCLVRANSKDDGLERLYQSFNRFNLPLDKEALGKIHIVVGNVSADKLGLPEEEYDLLANNIDSVVHCAIKANHLEEYADTLSNNSLRAVNVLGLLNILRFVVAQKTKTLCHASSLTAATKVSQEGIIDENYPSFEDYNEQLKNGYSISKLVGEILISQAADRGIPCKVIRYPSIWGNSESGFISLNNESNHAWSILTTCLRFQTFPYIDNENGITIVPVDVAAKLTIKLLLNNEVEYGLYNMTTTSSITQKCIEELMKEMRMDYKFVPLREWTQVVNKHDDSALEIFRTFYNFNEDEQELNFQSLHPFGKKLAKINSNSISEKMKKNLSDLDGLMIPAKNILEKHICRHLLNSLSTPV